MFCHSAMILARTHGSEKLSDLAKVTQPGRVGLPLDTTISFKNRSDILFLKEKARMPFIYVYLIFKNPICKFLYLGTVSLHSY